MGNPSLPRLREALEMGMGLVVSDVEEFDFGWLGKYLERATSIECYVPFESLAGAQLLPEAVSLRLLSFSETEVKVNLSELPHLEWAVVRGGGMVSAAGAPRVHTVAISFRDEKPRGRLDGLRLSPSVQSLNLQCEGVDLERPLMQVPGLKTLVLSDAKSVDLTAVRLVSELESLSLERVGRVDVSPLRSLLSIRSVGLNTIRDVSGVAALRDCVALRDVDIFRVRRMDDRDALLDLELDEFAGVGALFDEDFEKAIGRKSGSWYVEYPKPRKPRV